MLGACLQLFLLTVTGVSLQKPEEIYIKAGDMVALLCPIYTLEHNATVVWTGYTGQQVRVISDMSADEQEQVGMLVHGSSLVIFSAAADLQGNYSCSPGNACCLSWFSVTVYSTQSTEITEKTKHGAVCFTKESCTLTCLEVNIPDPSALNISSLNDITWHKEGESLPISGYFSSVEEKDQGDYTCTRSYLHNGHVYNTTFTVDLKVQPKKSLKTDAITSPNDNDVFEVDVGSTMTIDCKAVVYSESDEIFWLANGSFVPLNASLPVFYNYTRTDSVTETRVTATLVFKNVSVEDLSGLYTCKLESVSQDPILVTISLARKARPSYVAVLVIVVCIVVALSVSAVIYVRFKIDLTLFVRDTLGCRNTYSDGKSYDAFLLCYNSDTDAGLNDRDIKWLEGVLETSYGYSLCLCERDVLPGAAEAEAVLDCIEKSRTVVLVPTSLDSDSGSGLLSAIHATLVEHQSHLVFIKTETTKVPTSGVLPEALRQLLEAGNYVTWKGISSMKSSSAFLRQLRYHLSTPQHPPKGRPQTMQDVTAW